MLADHLKLVSDLLLIYARSLYRLFGYADAVLCGDQRVERDRQSLAQLVHKEDWIPPTERYTDLW